tara:strand:+ start:553 stop:717 length:165 start_codon:yes stop_codon:yes gene_type:complete
MKAYLVTCTYSGGTKQGYMYGEDYEDGTDDYNAELNRLTAVAQQGFDNWDAGDK